MQRCQTSLCICLLWWKSVYTACRPLGCLHTSSEAVPHTALPTSSLARKCCWAWLQGSPSLANLPRPGFNTLFSQGFCLLVYAVITLAFHFDDFFFSHSLLPVGCLSSGALKVSLVPWTWHKRTSLLCPSQHPPPACMKVSLLLLLSLNQLMGWPASSCRFESWGSDFEHSDWECRRACPGTAGCFTFFPSLLLPSTPLPCSLKECNAVLLDLTLPGTKGGSRIQVHSPLSGQEQDAEKDEVPLTLMHPSPLVSPTLKGTAWSNKDDSWVLGEDGFLHTSHRTQETKSTWNICVSKSWKIGEIKKPPPHPRHFFQRACESIPCLLNGFSLTA